MCGAFSGGIYLPLGMEIVTISSVSVSCFFMPGSDAALFHDVQAFAEAVEEDAHVLEDEGAAGFRSGICGGSKEGIYVSVGLATLKPCSRICVSAAR